MIIWIMLWSLAQSYDNLYSAMIICTKLWSLAQSYVQCWGGGHKTISKKSTKTPRKLLMHNTVNSLEHFQFLISKAAVPKCFWIANESTHVSEAKCLNRPHTCTQGVIIMGDQNKQKWTNDTAYPPNCNAFSVLKLDCNTEQLVIHQLTPDSSQSS